jgi:hypothetical protein
VKTIVSAVALFALLGSGLAAAVEVKERGAYIGGSVGVTSFDSDDTDFLQETGFSVDDSDIGVQVWAGYKFLSWIAAEVRYSYLGEYSVSGFAQSGGNNAAVNGAQEAAAVTGNAIFILPFGKSGVDIYGQLGGGILAYDLVNGSLNGFAGGESDDGAELVGTAGVGVRWTPAPPVTLSLGVDGWLTDIGGSELSVVMGQLGVQYNF